MTTEEIDVVEKIAAAATPGPWLWNSYSAIFAEVPFGSDLDDMDDGPNVNGKGIALIATIAQAPKFKGHGDELHHPETRANALFIETARSAVPALIADLKQKNADISALQKELAQFHAAINEAMPVDDPDERGRLLEWVWDELNHLVLGYPRPGPIKRNRREQ